MNCLNLHRRKGKILFAFPAQLSETPLHLHRECIESEICCAGWGGKIRTLPQSYKPNITNRCIWPVLEEDTLKTVQGERSSSVYESQNWAAFAFVVKIYSVQVPANENVHL